MGRAKSDGGLGSCSSLGVGDVTDGIRRSHFKTQSFAADLATDDHDARPKLDG